MTTPATASPTLAAVRGPDLGATARRRCAELLDTLVATYLSGDVFDEARFLQAWLSRKAGDLDRAAAQLEAIEKAAADVDPYEYARAAYWRGRILQAGGEPGRDAARQLWTDLAARYPTDYYGLLARARLAEQGAALPDPRPLPMVTGVGYDPGPLQDDPHLRAGLFLFRLGFTKAATDELEAVPLARVKQGQPLDPVLLVADVLDRLGDHRAAHRILRTRARDAFRRAPGPDNLRAWLIAYPPAYRDEVERAARASSVPPGSSRPSCARRAPSIPASSLRRVRWGSRSSCCPPPSRWRPASISPVRAEPI